MPTDRPRPKLIHQYTPIPTIAIQRDPAEGAGRAWIAETAEIRTIQPRGRFEDQEIILEFATLLIIIRAEAGQPTSSQATTRGIRGPAAWCMTKTGANVVLFF